MDGGTEDQFANRVTLFRAVTRDLQVSRARFQSTYDNWVEQRRSPSLPPGFLYAIAAGMDCAEGRLSPPIDPAKNADALALALAMLPGDQDALAFFGAAIGAGLFDKPGDGLKTRNKDRRQAMQSLINMIDRDAVEQVLPVASLQNAPVAAAQAHDENAIWIDPGHLLPAIILARRRLCRIVWIKRNGSRQTLGTGFLIGPSTVLTNHHVVEDITKAELREDELLCWFDYSDTTGSKNDHSAHHFAATDWKIADSPVGLKQPETGKHEWWNDDDVLDAWLADVADNLDYTAIRLASSPGLQRGWYDLQTLMVRDVRQAIVLHHPSGTDQTITLGKMNVSGHRDVRLFHQAATASGSSGGLVLNEYGEPIGLHHVGLKYEDQVADPANPGVLVSKNRFMNVAINLENVAKDLENKGVFTEISSASSITPVLGCIDGAHPVFGRTQLLKDLRTMWEDPAKRILMVHVAETDPPFKSPGKSFTIEIIQSLFRRPEHHHIVFKAGQTHADALAFAKDTVRSFAEDLVESVPEEPDTTTTAYVQTLVNFVVASIQDRLTNGMVWLMIDDLDQHHMSDASGREFLATLYNKISQTPNMRVVLIGLLQNTEISGINEENLLRSMIREEDLGDFHKLFKTWFLQRSSQGNPIDDTAIDLLSQTVGSYADQEEPLRAMANFVVDHMNAIAETLFGEAIPPPMPEDDP